MQRIDFGPDTWLAIGPMLTIVLLALVLLVVDFFTRENAYRSLFSAIACVGATLLMLNQTYFAWGQAALNGLVHVDQYSFIFYLIILGGGFLSFLLQDGQLSRQGVNARGVDVDVLMLLAMAGAMVMVSAANFIVLFLGFELLSVSVYALAGLARTEKASTEGALKYFILGAFSSAFLLYGMTLVYAATGSMSLHDVAVVIAQNREAFSANPVLLIGLGLIIFGFGFKVSLVPFHFWTPDVYQGAPSSITAFMAVIVKAAALGSFLRLMDVAFGELSGIWVGLIWSLSALTMTVGNFVALRQRSIKRMLAYSSIAHAGYMMMGLLVARNGSGGEAIIFYVVAYSLMTIASFGTVLLVTGGTDAQYARDDLSSFRGLGWRSPFAGFCMVIALLSLAGIPPLAGFFGKFYLFTAAVSGGYIGLAIIAALNSVVSLYYYLRVLVVMYFQEEGDPIAEKTHTGKTISQFAVTCATVGTIYLGLCSSTLFETARQAVKSLSSGI